VDGDSIYSGAEDNASGTAAVLAGRGVRRSGVQPARSLLFAGFARGESGLIGSQALADDPVIPLRNIAAILNLDVVNLYGWTRDVRAGTGPVVAGRSVHPRARPRAQGDRKPGGAAPGLLLPLGPLPVGPGRHLAPRSSTAEYVRPAGWGKEQQDKYIAERYHQPGDEILPWFSYDGAMQQLRVTVRTAVLVADAPAQPTWAASSEFRQAGEARVRGAGQATS
jgi:hypothetical protein